MAGSKYCFSCARNLLQPFRAVRLRSLYSSKSSSNNEGKKKKPVGGLKQVYSQITRLFKLGEKLPGNEVAERYNNVIGSYVMRSTPYCVIAQEAVDALVREAQRIASSDTLILESDPSLCVLTRNLLECGKFHRVRAFEGRTAFLKSVITLQGEYKDRVEHVKRSLYQLGRLQWLSNVYEEHEGCGDQLLYDYPLSEWHIHDKPSLLIVGAHGEQIRGFLWHLIISLATPNSLFLRGRPEFLLYLPKSLVDMLKSDRGQVWPKYQALSVAYQLFFDIQCLDELPADYFIPWLSRKYILAGGAAGRAIYKINENRTMVLVHISPKRSLLQHLNQKDLMALVFFIRQNMVARNRLVIQQMEKWIVGCGPRIIGGPISCHLYTRFPDLSPQQFLELFLQFTSWPEYNTSSFLSAVQKV